MSVTYIYVLRIFSGQSTNDVAVYLKQGAGCKGNCKPVPLNFLEAFVIMQAMLLAAGLGTRLRPYTLIRPKPLFPVLNQPLLAILLDMLNTAGCRKIVVNGHHLGDQVREVVREKEDVHYQHEPEILGTGGSLRQALNHLSDEPLLVMNGDIFHNIDLKGVYENHIRSGNRITMAVHDCPRFNTVGIRDSFIKTFHPDPSDELDVLAFTGIHVVDPSVIEMIPSGKFFHIIDLYEELAIQRESIGVYRVDSSLWEDIGTPDDYLGLHGRLLTGKISQSLPVPLPSVSWLVSNGAQLYSDIRFDGWGCVGRARIGSGVYLHNCVIWDGAVVEDGARLENMIVPPTL